MTTLAPVFGTSTAITWTSAATLAAAASAGCLAIDVGGMVTKADDLLITIAATLAVGTPADLKGCNIYPVLSEDGTHYQDNDKYAGTDAAVTLRSPPNFCSPYFLSCPDSGALTFYGVFSFLAQSGGKLFLPRKAGLVVENRTNLAFTAFSATYTPINFTNA